MTDITLFEIHLHDTSFTANAPGSGLPADEMADDDTDDSLANDDDTDVQAGGFAGRTLIPKLVALAVVVVLVVLARRVVGGEDEPVPT